jgi:hypothetical protein
MGFIHGFGPQPHGCGYFLPGLRPSTVFECFESQASGLRPESFLCIVNVQVTFARLGRVENGEFSQIPDRRARTHRPPFARSPNQRWGNFGSSAVMNRLADNCDFVFRWHGFAVWAPEVLRIC